MNSKQSTMFTEYQIEELVALLEIRMETVEDDVESGTDFENGEGNLVLLKLKLEQNSDSYTGEEIDWIIEEARTRQEVASGNADCLGVKVYGLYNSMQNVIDKVSKLKKQT